MLSTSPTVQVGEMVPQLVPAGGFTTSISGTYYFGTGEVVSYGIASAEQMSVNVLTLSNGSYNVVADYTGTASGSQQSDLTNSRTITVNSDGTFIANSTTRVNAIMISTTEFVNIDNASQSYPIIQVADSQ